MSIGIGKGPGRGSRKTPPSPAAFAEAADAKAETPHYHGHRDRLRARFQEAGAETLPDYELLELLLFRSIPQRDVKPLAKELIQRFGSFAEVLGAPVARPASLTTHNTAPAQAMKTPAASA